MVHLLARIAIWATAIVSAFMIFSVQLSMAPGIMLVGLSIPLVLLLPLHYLDPKTVRGEFAITPFSFKSYMGPYASELAMPLTYALLVLNILWAFRWLFGVENIATNLYGLSKNQTDYLKACGASHPFIESTATCNVIASFLDHPWAVYVHSIGAISCLIIGPLQLNGKIRSYMNYKIHRALGYAYVFFTLMGTIGALALMIKTTSGVSAGLGFFFLALAWNFTLSKGIYYAKKKNIRMHREWMIRNYFYTFSAIPFRFLPGIFIALGVPPEANVAYPVGTWLTLLLSALAAEKFLEFTRTPKSMSELQIDESVARGSTMEIGNPLEHNKL